MDLFLDINEDDALFFTAFLKRLKPEDYRRLLGDDESAAGAMAFGDDLALALRELGYVTI
jgi:hypothetical protein